MKNSLSISCVSTDAFISKFSSGTNTIQRFATFLTLVPGDWRTQPRKPEQLFGTHYCFYSSTAEMQVRLKDRDERVAPNTLCWFPPGVFYENYMRSNRSQESLKRLRFQICNGEQIFTPFTDFTPIPRASFCDQNIDRCAGAFGDNGAYADLRRRHELALFVMNACEAARDVSGDAPLGHALMARLDRYVVERLADWPTPAELAQVAGYNPAYFARLLRKQTGLPPRKWIIDRRIRYAARRLLTSRQSVQWVAHECGCDNPFFFSRQFKELMGSSPRTWRQQNDRKE